MIKIGDFVVDKYGRNGFVDRIYDNWYDLKAKNDFLSIDPDGESEDMDNISMLINGDPRDNWLLQQEIPFTDEQLTEKWYTVKLFNGGSIWTCKSSIKKLFTEN